MTIKRLDFMKPPPGFPVSDSPISLANCPDLVDAWAAHRRRNDPPGMWTGYATQATYTSNTPRLGVNTYELSPNLDKCETADVAEKLARAFAWEWYERRVALANRVETAAHTERADLARRLRPAFGLWPRCLTWPDDQVAAVDHWLADSSAEMPWVLRG